MTDRKLRVVFMGTPHFAVPTLQILQDAGYTIAGVVTTPDKLGGRGMKQVIVSPVKQFALDNQLPLAQPEKLRDPSFLSQLDEWKADIQVVVAFRMLPEIVWNKPPLGTINLHSSLLPAYRGAAPIQWAIINGEKETGITTFRLKHEIDTGSILLQERMPILDSDNASSLHDRMMHRGAGLMLATIDSVVQNSIQEYPQKEGMVSHAPKLTRENTRLDWSQNSVNMYNMIRGLSPYPGAWTLLDEIELKIFESRITNHNPGGIIPGDLFLEGNKLFVKTLDGCIEILNLQLAGKRRMNTKEFLNGYKIKIWKLL